MGDSGPPIDKRIIDIYGELPPGERAVADIIIEQRGNFVGYSATELADQAEVSKATAARLFKRLGYKSVEDARRLARKVSHWNAALQELERTPDIDPGVETHVSTEVANLKKTFQGIAKESLDEALNILSGARTIWIMGLRNSFGLAHYARFIGTMLHGDVRMIPQGGLSFAEEVLNMKRGDAMLVIGFRRRPSALRKVMTKAHELGVKIVFITDMSAANTTKVSDVVFRCFTKGQSLYDSYTAGVSILNYLGGALAIKMGAVALERLSKLDDLHDEIDAFNPRD